MHKSFIRLFTLVLLLAAAPAEALTVKEKVLVREAETILNAMQTAVAEFVQTAPDGETSYGTFFFKRPGKIRWQYNPPVPILIVANNGKLAYQDFELDQVSYLSADESLMNLLARQKLKLEEDFDIPLVQVDGNELWLRLERQRQGAREGLLLIFDRQQKKLLRLELADAAEKVTTVEFRGWKMGQNLEDKLFRIDETQRLLNKKPKNR